MSNQMPRKNKHTLVSSSRDKDDFEHRQNSVSLGVLIQNVTVLSLIIKRAGVRIIPPFFSGGPPKKEVM